MLTFDLVSNLNPGGYIELFDPIYPISCDDNSVPPDSALYRWSVMVNEAGAKLGSSLDTALHYREQLADAGFINLVFHRPLWTACPCLPGLRNPLRLRSLDHCWLRQPAAARPLETHTKRE